MTTCHDPTRQDIEHNQTGYDGDGIVSSSPVSQAGKSTSFVKNSIGLDVVKTESDLVDSMLDAIERVKDC